MLQVACLRLLNAIVETTLTSKERAYLQAEMEEAGFEPAIIRKVCALSMAVDGNSNDDPQWV